MASILEVVTKLANIEKYIDDALSNEVAETAKQALLRSASQNVYSYRASERAMQSRRYAAGGIGDMRLYTVDVKDGVLTVASDAPYRGSPIDDLPLREAIAQGVGQGGAGKRPFHEEAEKEIINDGEAMDALRRGLARQGVILDRGGLDG